MLRISFVDKYKENKPCIKNAVKNNEELLLRRQAAKGEFQQIQEILNRNKINLDFNINTQSSNGNTALHWACLNARELYQDPF